MKNLREKLISTLHSGLDTNKIAFALSLGFIIGIMPFYGLATLLCFMAAFIFRLNAAVIQLANYASLPIMFVLFIPFYKFGNLIFQHKIPSLGTFEALSNENIFLAFSNASKLIFNALALWAIIAPFGLLLFYVIFQQVIHRMRSGNVNNFFKF